GLTNRSGSGVCATSWDDLDEKKRIGKIQCVLLKLIGLPILTTKDYSEFKTRCFNRRVTSGILRKFGNRMRVTRRGPKTLQRVTSQRANLESGAARHSIFLVPKQRLLGDDFCCDVVLG